MKTYNMLCNHEKNGSFRFVAALDLIKCLKQVK